MVDKKFKEAVEKENIPAIRDMLKNRLLMDHDVTGGMFSECWVECKRQGITEKLYQEPDGRSLSGEKSESNYNALVGQLATNFSRDRLNKIISLAKAIWADEQSDDSSKTQQSGQASDSLSSEMTGSSSSSNERIIGERILKERIVRVKELDAGEETHFDRGEETRSTRRTRRSSLKGDMEGEGSKPGSGALIAAAVVAVAAVVAGIVIFG